MWLTAVVLQGCVEPFTPEINESQESLVVEGMLTDQSGIQTIYLSRSSPFNYPGFIPERYSVVWIVDENGTYYQLSEQEEGVYQLYMTPFRGTSYKLRIITTDNQEYESDYVMLPSPCPSIDSIYFEIETRETEDPEEPLEGIQFYLDLEAGEDEARNYRWELEETWAYNAAHIIQYYYDGVLHNMDDPFKYYHCWYTGRISNIFTASSKHSVSNRIYKYPLHYVSSETHRLQVRYSLLVKQYALSDEAFEYWDQMRMQLQESGGLYEAQPPQIRGNIYNVDDPNELVMGFFSVASVAEKRIFVDIGREFHYPRIKCILDTINRMDEIPPPVYFPVYMRSLSPMGTGPPYGVGRGICFDCRYGGGSIEKPDFWE
ncbi:MAG: hypothetical protein AMS27_10675 [Bacteroides sp. SM23_62_1]|nr:MAG: hypothetical protein AMS27_10675 [Bacteroides sp. SM23_62_1]